MIEEFFFRALSALESPLLLEDYSCLPPSTIKKIKWLTCQPWHFFKKMTAWPVHFSDSCAYAPNDSLHIE